MDLSVLRTALDEGTALNVVDEELFPFTCLREGATSTDLVPEGGKGSCCNGWGGAFVGIEGKSIPQDK